MAFVSVLLDDALDKSLDYRIPSGLMEKIQPGMRVLVPVRKSLRKATILQVKNQAEVENPLEVHEILSEKPLISEDLFALCAWISRYYCCSLRKVLRVALPPSIRQDQKHKTQLFVKSLISKNELVALCEKRKSPSQSQVLDVMLLSPKGILLSALLEKASVSRSPVDSLVKNKILTLQEIQIDRTFSLENEYFQTVAKKLNPSQEEALQKIKEGMLKKKFETHLLFGVTGSGKTEVYLQAIEYALSLNKGAILLVPEIALTSQTIERLKSRFKEKIAILHHRLGVGERHDSWHHIKSGAAKIVVGARSAIFSPVENLGLIMVDEEHEPSYKQTDEAPCYHARDVAVMRGKFLGAQVVLGTATPSLESYHNALQGKYTLSVLKARADKAASLPTVTIVDMQKEWEKNAGFTLFSDALLQGIKKRIEQGEQTILFLNKRGYHRSQACLKCSFVVVCPHCEVSLTFHLGENILACHLCDHRIKPHRTCPECKCEEGLKYKGAGTELVEKALHAIFENVRTLRLDADTTRHKGSHDILFKQFRSGKADVLIGTQMIAKGLHFPSVTLVGILDADGSLHIPDFRASEHVFQLITQVCGRSGRGHIPGEAIIQTHMPTHPLIQHASRQDFEGFYKEEIESRKQFEYPPFTHLVKCVFSGTSSADTYAYAQKVRQFLIQKLPPSFEILPPLPCGHPKIKDNYRFQFLIKGEKVMPLTGVLEQARMLFTNKNVRMLIDIDPLSTFF